MDEQGKPEKKRGGDDVVGEREEKEGPSQVLPLSFPFVFGDDDSDDDDLDTVEEEEDDKNGSDNELDWSSRVMPLMPPSLSAAMSMFSKDVFVMVPDDPCERPLDPEALKKYNQQIEESEGFDIFYYPGPSIWTPVVPLTGIKESPSDYAAVVNLAKLAINQYNVEHNEAYEFIDLERVNSRVVSGCVYYITFQVKNRKAAGDGNVDGDDTSLETFQARVWEGIMETEVELCRPKPIKQQN